MANLPQNQTYNNAGSTPVIPKSRYTPSTTYQNLAQLRGKNVFEPEAPALPGTPEYFQQKQVGISQYGNLINNGMGIPTQTQFLPPIGDPKTPIPIPEEYGSFMAPMTIDNGNEKLSWGTPTAPVIRNANYGDVPGQYVQDTANPNLLVKTNRGSNSIADDAIRNGRPGFMYQIDHIMPLFLGGADTLANRQLLTSDQNDKKTKAQAVPYTLYANGDITLSEARAMAMQWKDRDVTDIPQPNSVGMVSDTRGKTGIEIARETAKRWTEPPKMTVKGFFAQIPDTMKNLGEGYLPDPVREFVKGFASGTTLGFLPYEQDDNEGMESKIAGIAGMAVGGIASFMLGNALIGVGLKAAGLARGAIAGYRGVALAEATANGFGAAKTAATVAGLADEAQVVGTTFRTLNKAPGFLKTILTPEAIKQAGRFAATSAVVGQGQQFIENKFNPYILAGVSPEHDAGMKATMGRIFKDLAMGAIPGASSPTIKGTAYATMLPLTLSFIANPDDPETAITNGVIFGAMHAMGSYKNPSYNDVKAFGGKPYENPVVKAFEATANKAAYASLSHYAPEVYPTLKGSQEVPTAAHLPEAVQQAKDAAIENVWKRFFFGKEVTPEVKTKTLSDFKGFSENLNEGLNASNKPKLSVIEKLSLGKRKEAHVENKAQDVEITKQFGKDYQKRNELKNASVLPEDGMDLQTALTEIKRITVASRQLYKGGLVGEMRNRADVDDLLSFSKNKLQGRFEAQEKYTNPPIAKQAVDAIDESFMKNSFNNDRRDPSGKYPNGDAALTGAALNINKESAAYFFEQRAKGNASPNILLVDRADTAPLWSMKNSLIDPADVKLKKYAPDPNPDNALQAFGVVKNPQTGQKELVPLGWMASDFRLNEATGQGHRALNQHPAVLEWKETGGESGLRPLDLHKDQIAPVMRKEGISILVANLDPRATLKTIESGNPFIPVNFNDQNWTYSKSLGDRLSQQGNDTPISMAISKVAKAMGTKQKMAAISEMNQKIEKPAYEYIPKNDIRTITPEISKVTVPQETTRGVVKDITDSLDVADPAQLKQSFQKNFGILLQDTQANEIFARKNELTMRDGVNILVQAVRNGSADAATRVKLDFVKTYLESGILQASEGGKAVLDMRLVGKMKQTPFTGQEEHMVTPRVVTPITKPLDVKNYSDVSAPVAVVEPAIATAVAQPVQPVPVIESASPLANKITSTAREYLKINKKPVQKTNGVISQEPGPEAANTAKFYIEEGKAKLEDAKVGGPGYTSATQESVTGAVKKEASIHNSIISSLEKRIQSDMQRKGASAQQINDVKQATRTALEGHSEFILGPDANLGFTGGEVLDRPKFIARDFYNSLEQSIANNDNPGAQYFAKSMDEGLKAIIGPNYRNDPTLPKLLANYFNNVFFNEVNSSGRGIQQHKDIVNARGRGDFQAEKAAFEARNEQLKANPTGEGGELSPTEFANRGIDAEDLNTGMNVKPWYQDDSMVHDLTQGEDMMAALFSDAPKGAATSVRAIKKLFLDKNNGLIKYLLDEHPKAKSGSIQFGKLEKEAVARDEAIIKERESEQQMMKESEELLPMLKKQYEMLQKALKDPEERTNWQTPELLQDNIQELTKKMKELVKRVNSKTPPKDNKGGPGKHDGKGGPGGLVGNLWGKIKNKLGTKKPEPAAQEDPFLNARYNNLNQLDRPRLRPESTAPESPFLNAKYPNLGSSTQRTAEKIDIPKLMRAIAQNETSIIKDNPYGFSQPSGEKELGLALGKYQLTEYQLKKNGPKYLGRAVSSKEYLASPKLQETYMHNRSKDLEEQGFTPEQIADSWRSGTTLGEGKYRDQDYVNKFNLTYKR